MSRLMHRLAFWWHCRRNEVYLLDLDARRRIMSPSPKGNRLEWGLVVVCVVAIVFAQAVAWVRAGDAPCPPQIDCADTDR